MSRLPPLPTLEQWLAMTELAAAIANRPFDAEAESRAWETAVHQRIIRDVRFARFQRIGIAVGVIGLLGMLLLLACERTTTTERAAPLGLVAATNDCAVVPKPTPEPPQTVLWSEQDPNDDTVWRFYVPGWVPAPNKTECWEVGRVPLRYHNDDKSPLVHEPVYRPGEEPLP